MYLCIYTYRERERDGESTCIFTDGIGTPDPNPEHLVNVCFGYG